jgi:hypothetical protein
MKKQIKWVRFDEQLAHPDNRVKYQSPFNGEGEDIEGFQRNADDEPPFRVINTSMGPMSIPENSLAYKRFEFWTIHTNFNIGQRIANVIVDTPGVETFSILTPYSVRIGLTTAGLFDNEQVRKQIDERVLNLFNPPKHVLIPSRFEEFDAETQTKIEEQQKELAILSPNWALYIFPSGQMQSVESESKGGYYKEKLELFRNTVGLIGGALYTSEE